MAALALPLCMDFKHDWKNKTDKGDLSPNV